MSRDRNDPPMNATEPGDDWLERLLVDRTSRVVENQVALLKSRLDPVTEHLDAGLLGEHGRKRLARNVALAGRHRTGHEFA